MNSGLIYALAGVGLCGIGLVGFTCLRHLLRRLMAFNLMGSGTFLVLVGLAQSRSGEPDPVAQALVLTGIVVAIAATALAVVLTRHWFDLTGRTQLDEPDESC